MMTRAVLHPTFVVLLAAVAAGQQPEGAGQRPNEPQRTVSVDFPGGTLSEFAAALRQAGRNVNILLPESASKVRVPTLILRETTVEAALRAVTTVVDSTVQLHVEVATGSLPGHGPFGEPVYSVRVRQAGDQGGAPSFHPASQHNVRVFSLRGLTQSTPADTVPVVLEVKTILTAIDTGLSVASESGTDDERTKQRPVLRYHEDSGLLFVAGDIQQIRMVEEVLVNLERSLKLERSPQQPPQPRQNEEPRPATPAKEPPAGKDDAKKDTRAAR